MVLPKVTGKESGKPYYCIQFNYGNGWEDYVDYDCSTQLFPSAKAAGIKIKQIKDLFKNDIKPTKKH